MTKKIKEALKKIGLSNKELDLYVFLSTKGAQKGTDIAKQFKMHRGHVYRILKKLEKKSVIETTLEYPKRFLAVPINMIIDSFIITKREEVSKIEQSKDDLLSDWQKIKQSELTVTLNKFCVIEGETKIFHKISQMVKEAKKEFFTIFSVYELIRADNFGIFEEAKNNFLKDKVRFNFLTQITKGDLKAIKIILEDLSSAIKVKGIDSDRTLSVFPRLLIKDRKEILLFISNDEKNESALYTDCKSIIDSFYGVFKDLWGSSVDINKRIIELETGKPAAIMELIKDSIVGRKKYFDALDAAKEDIFIVTSSDGLLNFLKKIDLVKKWSKNGISTKIMAPITTQNLEALELLLPYCEVKHSPIGYRETTIIDNSSLFQFNYPVGHEFQDVESLKFENIFFTNNLEYIKRTSVNLLDAWMKTHTPPTITLNNIIGQSMIHKNEDGRPQTTMLLQRIREYNHLNDQKITKEIVLTKIKKLKRYPITDPSTNNIAKVYRSFGSVGSALIHPPPQLKLPEFIIVIAMFNDESSYGATNHLTLNVKNKRTSNSIYEPVAIVDTNPKLIDYRKMVYKGNPVEHNIILAKDSEFKIFIQGNSLFACWTFPIPFLSGKYVLPPSSILFEGYGEIKSGVFKNIFRSCRMQEVYFNRLDSFVTYFHPSMKYACAGTEGFLDRETAFTSSSLIQNQDKNLK